MGEVEPNPTPVQALDYRTAPPPERSRTWIVVLILVTVAVFLVVPVLWLVVRAQRSTGALSATVVTTITPAPTVVAQQMQVDWETQQRRQAYEHYLTYSPASDKVVYEEDPVAAGKLFSAQPPQHRPLAGGNLDHPWGNSFQRPVMETSPAGITGVPPFVENAQPDRCVLFVGKLTSPVGNARLVFLDMNVTLSGTRTGGRKGGGGDDPEYEVKIQRKLSYRIFDGAATEGFPSQLRMGTSLTVKTPTDTIPIRWIDGSLRADRSAGSGIRFYGGVPDPRDPAHCTVDYEYGGRRATIDVYLTDDDFLRVLPRGSTVNGGTWEVAAANTGTDAVEKPSTRPDP